MSSPTTTAPAASHVVPRRPARHVAARGGRRARGHDLLRARRRHLARVPRRFPRGRAAAALPLDRAHAGRAAADPPRPDQAAPLPGAQLDRGLARLPARLRFLLQGGVLRGRQVVLHADRGRRAGRDRPAARPPPVLPRRPSVRQPALRRRPVRRHARHGPPLAGGRHGQAVLPPGLLEKAVACGPAQPVRRLRDPQPRQPREQRKYQNLGRDYAPRSAGCTTSA